MKRYCQCLTLVDDEQMISKYVEAHAHVWPEIIEGQRQVGIIDMQIYRKDRNLFVLTFGRHCSRSAMLKRAWHCSHSIAALTVNAKLASFPHTSYIKKVGFLSGSPAFFALYFGEKEVCFGVYFGCC